MKKKKNINTNQLAFLDLLLEEANGNETIGQRANKGNSRELGDRGGKSENTLLQPLRWNNSEPNQKMGNEQPFTNDLFSSKLPKSEQNNSKNASKRGRGAREYESRAGFSGKSELNGNQTSNGIEEVRHIRNGAGEDSGITDTLRRTPSELDNTKILEKLKQDSRIIIQTIGFADAPKKIPGKITFNNNKPYIISSAIEEISNKKIASNSLEAIKTLKLLEKEQRLATENEKSILAEYRSFGGAVQTFHEDNQDFKSIREELKSITTTQEYQSLKEATSDSFYTNDKIINFIYQSIEKLGYSNFDNLRILEPSCGSGNFIGYMPKKLKENSYIEAVELDSTASNIAKHLYQSKNITIYNKPFQNVPIEDNKFDIVLGNFPFGSQIIYDNNSPYASGKNLHNYFLAKSIEALNDKGILIAVTSSQFLNSKDSILKEQIASKADFKGAIRLPVEAFKTANTQAICDILIFQKNDNKVIDKEKADKWIHHDFSTENYDYSGKHDEFMYLIGEKITTTNQFGKNVTISKLRPHLSLDGELKYILSHTNIIQDISKDFKPQGKTQNLEKKAFDNVPKDTFVGELYRENNQIFVKGKNNQGTLLDISSARQKDIEALHDYLSLKEELKTLLNDEVTNPNNKSVHEQRIIVNQAYDSFVEKHGHLKSQKNKKLLQLDIRGSLVANLEIKDNKKNIHKADILHKRLMVREDPLIQNIREAMYYSISTKGKIDIDYIANIKELSFNGNNEAVIKELTEQELVLYNPKLKVYELKEKYLSGDIYEKLEELDSFMDNMNYKDYQNNKKLLEQSLPKQIKFSDIQFNLSSTWIPTKIKKAIIEEILVAPYKAVNLLEYEPLTSSYGVQINAGLSIANTQIYGTEYMRADEIITKIFKRQSLTIYRTDDDGKKHIEIEKSEVVKQKANLIEQKFYDIIANNPTYTKELEEIYNKKFNSYIACNYKNGDLLNFSNMSHDIELRPHQKRAILRGILEDGYMLDHVVGAGKTFTMIATVMERKRMGIDKKPLIIVPNHLVGQWEQEFMRLYPNANILCAKKDNFTKEDRENFVANATLNDWDCVIMSHSSFEKLPMSNEYMLNNLNQEIIHINEMLDFYESQNNRSFGVKQLKKTKDSYLSKIASITEGKSKDSIMNFDSIGFDALYVDEAHEFKNLQFYTKQSSIAGINPNGSNKAYDLYMKCKYINSKKEMETNKKDKGVFFATGTPLSNSLAELYTMTRYLDSSMLQKMGVSHFDAWSSVFTEVETKWQVNSTGKGFESKTMFSKFLNIPELSKMYLQTADVIINDDIKDYVKLPQIETGKPINTVVPITEAQQEYMNEIVERVNKIKSGAVDPTKDNMLKITTEAKKLSIDITLLDKKEEHSNKIMVLTENVAQQYHKWTEDKGTQLIFCDMSTPSSKKDKNDTCIYDDITNMLIEKGVSPKEIAYIHDYKSDDDKVKLFEQVNNGSIRILIGSSQKMGAGMNVQKRLVALHHMDAPWRPTDLQQREGRIIRQGNILNDKYKNFAVNIQRYATENSYDSRLWQILQNKADFITQFKNGSLKTRSGEDIGGDEEVKSAEEMKAIASGNPYAMLYLKLEDACKKADIVYRQEVSSRSRMQQELDDYSLNQSLAFNNVNKRLEIINDFIASKKSPEFEFSAEQVSATILKCRIKEKNTGIIIEGMNLSEKQIENRKNKFSEVLENKKQELIDKQSEIINKMEDIKKVLATKLDNSKLLLLKNDKDTCYEAMKSYEINKILEDYEPFLPKSTGFEKDIEHIKNTFNRNKENIKNQSIEQELGMER